MKAIILIFPLFAVLNFNAQAKMYVPEVLHDFETLNQYDQCQHDFMVINKGDQPLIISNVKTSCGCDVPSWDKEPVMPGDTTWVNYKYDSKRIGPINKSMTIQSNDAETPIFVVRVKGVILPNKEEN